MRDTTERPEAVDAGTVILVGTNTEKIVSEATLLLNDKEKYNQMSALHNPYGDGKACEKNCRIYRKIIKMNNPEVVMIGLGYIGLPTAALIAVDGTTYME